MRVTIRMFAIVWAHKWHKERSTSQEEENDQKIWSTARNTDIQTAIWSSRLNNLEDLYAL